MQYLQLTISYHYDSAATSLRDEDLSDWLIAELGPLGFDSFEQDAYELKAFIPTEQYDATATCELLDGFPAAGFSYTLTVEELPDINWNEEWEANGFEPICIEGRCIIFDARHYSAADLPAGFHLQVAIEPRQAFGTGTHETTQMVVAQLLGMPLQGKRLLDCGCGTGILGIVASKLGAESVLGYDIDEWSVDNSLHNAILNDVANMVVRKGDATSLTAGDGPFDVVVANINRNILLADLPRWVQAMAKKGTIVLSGFYQADVSMLVTAATNLGLRLVSESEQEGWACLTFSKE